MRKRIAVIGGGPAGSAVTLRLLQRGVDPGDIVIFDKATFPRPKLCGGAITFRGAKDLRDLGLADGDGTPTRGLDLHSPFGKLHLREPGPQLLFDRAYLDDRLLARCRDAGVEVREACKVDGLEPGVGAWRVRAGGAVTEASWVVGADGASGVTRRTAGLRGGPTGRLFEGVFESPAAPPAADVLHFYFDPIPDGIAGYAWIFPYPLDGRRDLWKIGVMDTGRHVTSERLRAWVLAFAARHGFTKPASKLAGWPEHFYDWRSAAHRPGLLLVGETHGADPLFGEGIAPSFAMAAFAAPRLKAALDAGRSVIPWYSLRFAISEEGRNLVLQSMLARMLYGPNGARWLRSFFENEHIRALGPQGIATYGRLLRHTAEIARAYMRGALTRDPNG